MPVQTDAQASGPTVPPFKRVHAVVHKTGTRSKDSELTGLATHWPHPPTEPCWKRRCKTSKWALASNNVAPADAGNSQVARREWDNESKSSTAPQRGAGGERWLPAIHTRRRGVLLKCGAADSLASSNSVGLRRLHLHWYAAPCNLHAQAARGAARSQNRPEDCAQLSSTVDMMLTVDKPKAPRCCCGRQALRDYVTTFAASAFRDTKGSVRQGFKVQVE